MAEHKSPQTPLTSSSETTASPTHEIFSSINESKGSSDIDINMNMNMSSLSISSSINPPTNPTPPPPPIGPKGAFGSHADNSSTLDPSFATSNPHANNRNAIPAAPTHSHSVLESLGQQQTSNSTFNQADGDLINKGPTIANFTNNNSGNKNKNNSSGADSNMNSLANLNGPLSTSTSSSSPTLTPPPPTTTSSSNSNPNPTPTPTPTPPEEEVYEEEESEEDSSSDDLSESSEASWIEWFCTLRGNEFFVVIDEDYIQDDFNLTGLNSLVPYYDYALDMILDVEVAIDEGLTEEQQEVVESAAEMLYGLIHARYLVTSRGVQAAQEKYNKGIFGVCPRVFCHGQHVLPVGLSDLPRNYTVNVFCPRCYDIFYPKSTRQANIDGAYFGTTFPHLYLMTHPDLVPPNPSTKYNPRVYGFKINKESLYHRNKLLTSGGGRENKKGKRK